MEALRHTTAITRRAAVGVLGAAGLGFAVLGPRPRKDAPGGRVVLDYWEKWTGQEGRAMQRLVDRYNASQDRVFVRYFAMAGIGQKALIAIAGGDPPDIIGLWNFNIPAYAEAGALVALDELAAEFGIRREDYAAAVWPLLTHRDRLWGVVSTCGTVALYYNRAMFREAGLDPDRPPRTIDEFDEYNRRLTVVEGGSGGEGRRLARVGFIHTEPGWWSWLWGYFFGGTLYDGARDRATAASAENVAGYRWVQSYAERYGADALISFQSGLGVYGSAQNAFILGKVAMVNQGPWLVNTIVQYKPGMEYAVAPFPVEAGVYDAQRPIGLLDSDVLVIPRGTRHPREAMAFIAFTQRRENIEQLSREHCKNSPLAASSPEFLSSHPNPFVHVHDAIAQSPRAFVFPRTRTWPEYEKEFNAGMQRMWRLQEPAAGALERIQDRAQAQLDDAALRRTRRAELRGERA